MNFQVQISRGELAAGLVLIGWTLCGGAAAGHDAGQARDRDRTGTMASATAGDEPEVLARKQFAEMHQYGSKNLQFWPKQVGEAMTFDSRGLLSGAVVCSLPPRRPRCGVPLPSAGADREKRGHDKP